MSKEKTNLKLVIGGLICIKPRVKTSGQFRDGKLKSSWTAILWPDSANASRVSMSSRLFQDESSRLSIFSGWCLSTWKFKKYIYYFLHFWKNGCKKLVFSKTYLHGHGVVMVITEIKNIWVAQNLLEQGHLAFVIPPGSIQHIDREWALKIRFKSYFFFFNMFIKTLALILIIDDLKA